MKNTFAFLLMLLSVGLYAQSNADPDFEDLICKEAEAHSRFLNLSPAANHLLTNNYDLKYYRFDWYIDPAQYFIRGKATVYFTTLTDDFAEINFDFSTQLVVDSIEYHGQLLTATQSGDYLLSIPLPSALQAGALDSLTIAYSGTPPSSGFGSFIQSQHNGIPSLWTLSEPFGSQDWWPCKNGLDDKIDSIDVFITTPAQYRGASNGALVSEIAEGDNRVYHWKHRYAIAPYLVAVSVTNYVQYTDMAPLSNGAQLPIVNYVYPENLAQAQAGTANLVQVLQFFDSLFVTYPFHAEKYGHAQFGWGGGMEHQTMSFVVNFGWGLLAHELAHQWFGDMVTCGAWEDIWLNEGFATYLEGLTRERFPTGTTWYNWKKGKVDNIVSQSGGSVKVDDPNNVGRIFSGRLTYNKGSYLLHMLRWKLGDEDFFQAVRNYLNDRAFNYATTPSLKAHLEAASGADLSGFFADWYEGQGYPSYQAAWEQNSVGKVYIQLSQTTSHPSVDFFEMPVPVRLSGEGRDTLVRLEHTENNQLFDFDLPFLVESVSIDADYQLISANNTVEQMELVGVQEPVSAEKAVIYPNPANDFIRIRPDQNLGPFANWQICNTLGQPLLSGNTTENPTQIGIGNLPPGAYRLTLISTAGRIKTGFFIKE